MRPDVVRPTYDLARLVSSLVAAGHLATAERLARVTDDWNVHDKVTLGVVLRAAEADDLRQALSAARSITATRSRDNALTTIAQELAKSDDVALAVRIARSIDNPGQQAEALASIVRTMVVAIREPRRAWRAAPRLGQAVRIARSVPDPTYRMSAMAAVLSAARLAGTKRLVRAILKQMVIRSCDLAPYDGNAASIAVHALVACGAVRQASTVGHAIADPFYRSIVIAAALVPRSMPIAMTRTSSPPRRLPPPARSRRPGATVPLPRLPRSLARAGHQATALTAVAAMPRPGPRAAALVEVAGASQQAALAAEALSAVRAIEPVRERAEALLNLVPTFGSAGHPDYAVESFTEGVAAAALSPWMSGYGLTRAADALVEAGRGDDAEAVIRSMGDSPVAGVSPGRTGEGVEPFRRLRSGRHRRHRRPRVSLLANHRLRTWLDARPGRGGTCRPAAGDRTARRGSRSSGGLPSPSSWRCVSTLPSPTPSGT